MIKKIFTLLCLCTLCIGSAWGETVVLDGSVLTSTATEEESTITQDEFSYKIGTGIKYQTSTKATNSFGNEKSIFLPNNQYIYNTTSFGNLTKLELYSNYGASTSSAVSIAYSETEFTSEPSKFAVEISLSTANKVYDCGDIPNGTKYIYIKNTSSKNAQIQLRATYTPAPSKTLESISITGTPTKKTYKEGESFDPAGLVLTGTYNDKSQETITSGITWTFDPDPLTAGTTSVSVTAKVLEKTSEAYIINDLTVNAVQKYTVQFSVNGEVTKSEPKCVGESVVFPEVSSVAGYTFMGWVANNFDGKQDEEPEYLENFLQPANNDALCFAVFAKECISGTSSLVKMAKGDSLQNGDKIVIVANGTDVALYRETISTSYVNKYTFDNKVETIASSNKYWIPVTSVTGGFTLGDYEDGFLYNSNNNLYCGNTDRVWVLQDLEDGTFRFMTSGEDNRYLSYRSDLTSNIYWRMGGASKGTSGQTILDIYKYNTTSISYTDYTTFVGYTREVTAGNFGTICLPYASSATAGATFYTLAGKKMNDQEVASIVLEEVEGNLVAGTPYIFKASDNEITVAYTGAVSEAGSANGLIGTFERIEQLERGTYIVSGTKFYCVDSPVSCGANRAYIDMSIVSQSQAKGDIEMFNGSEPTSINGMNIEIISNSPMYNLNGQRVNSNYNGVVLKNGKKYLNK